MSFQQTLTDAEFLGRFEDHSLQSFSHRDHIRVAYAYACQGGVEAAVAGARHIRDLAEASGHAGKYHETLTVAWARVIAHLVMCHPPSSFSAFLDAHPQLEDRGLLLRHYSRQRLFSADARTRFLEPDLLALP